VRQPLAELVVDVRDDADRARLPGIADQLKDELNVKAVRDAREVGGLLKYAVRPNLRQLGPKYAKALGRIRAGLEAVEPAVIAAAVEAGRAVRIAGEFDLLPEEILVDRIATEGYATASGEGYVVGVSLELTPDLRAEGIAREVVHLVQNQRKDSGLEIADRIELFLDGPPEVVEAVRSNETYVKEEVLAQRLEFGPAPSGAPSTTHTFDGYSAAIGIRRS
jgi:isoleucyl-tRNA synthetase